MTFLVFIAQIVSQYRICVVFSAYFRQINNYGTQRLFFTTRLCMGTELYQFIARFWSEKKTELKSRQRQNSFEDNGRGRLKVEMEPSTATTALTTALTTTTMVKVTALERIETF